MLNNSKPPMQLVSGAGQSVSGTGQSVCGPGGQSLVPASRPLGWTVGLCDRMLGLWGQFLQPDIRSQGPVCRSLRLDSRSLEPIGQSLVPDSRSPMLHSWSL